MSRFLIWTIHGGWAVTGTLTGLVIAIKLIGLILVQGQYIDPFKRYDAILPGHPISVLSAYSCSVNETRINGRIYPVYFSCVILPQDGYFDIIHVEGLRDQITEVTFYATHVDLGQPLLHWKPLVRPKYKDNGIVWNTPFYSIAVLSVRLNYQIPIRIFTVSEISDQLQ